VQLVINRLGRVACLYAETIDLSTLGPLVICRASHVEADARGQWWADLSPVGGPQLGPFTHRSAALATEQRWLESHWLHRRASPDL
jgi:hypothetical protein